MEVALGLAVLEWRICFRCGWENPERVSFACSGAGGPDLVVPKGHLRGGARNPLASSVAAFLFFAVFHFSLIPLRVFVPFLYVDYSIFLFSKIIVIQYFYLLYCLSLIAT